MRNMINGFTFVCTFHEAVIESGALNSWLANSEGNVVHNLCTHCSGGQWALGSMPDGLRKEKSTELVMNGGDDLEMSSLLNLDFIWEK